MCCTGIILQAGTVEDCKDSSIAVRKKGIHGDQEELFRDLAWHYCTCIAHK